MLRIDREKKRQLKKERENKQKFDLRQKMSVIATTAGIDNDEELHLPQRLWEDIRKTGFDELDENDESQNSESDQSDEDEEMESDQEDNSDVDEKAKAISRMADEMESEIAKQKEYASRIDRKIAGSEIKKK